jgi:hypothetical protein
MKTNGIKICGSMWIILILAIIGIFVWLTNETHLHYESNSDTFWVDILEVKSHPNYFLERIRVKCLGDMNAGIWVSDLKKAGIFPSKGQTGEAVYREGHPHQAGYSAQINADEKFSACQILFTVNTSSNGTAWHSEVAGGTCVIQRFQAF